MKTINIVLSLIFIILFSQCPIGYQKFPIIIVNNSNTIIKYNVADLGSEKIYPDTSLSSNTFPSLYSPANSQAEYQISREWEEIFNELPSDTLSIYFFHPDTLLKYNWEIIRDEYKIMVRYDLSYQDLVRLDFRVYYPPDYKMKGIKRYQPN